MKLKIVCILALLSSTLCIKYHQEISIIDDETKAFNATYGVSIDKVGLLKIEYAPNARGEALFKVARPFDREIGVEGLPLQSNTSSAYMIRCTYDIKQIFEDTRYKFVLDPSTTISSFILELPRLFNNRIIYGLDIAKTTSGYNIISPSKKEISTAKEAGEPSPIEFRTSTYVLERDLLRNAFEAKDDCQPGRSKAKTIVRNKLHMVVQQYVPSELDIEYVKWECDPNSKTPIYEIQAYKQHLDLYAQQCSLVLPEPPRFVDRSKECIGSIIGRRYDGFSSAVIYRSGRDPILIREGEVIDPPTSLLVYLGIGVALGLITFILILVYLRRQKSREQIGNGSMLMG